MAELLITSSIDPIEAGQVFEKTLPRHLTIWQYFSLPDVYLGAFANEVGRAVSSFPPLEVLGTDMALFGPENDLPVRRVMALGSGATVIALHTILGMEIDRYDGIVRNPEWAYENFNPHVTFVDGEALEAAEYAKLKTVELVEKDTETGFKHIRNVWNLEELTE